MQDRKQESDSAPAENSPAQGLRLNRAIAQAGLCSRRSADEWIQSGRVVVNSATVLEPGLRLKAGDVLEVDGKLVTWELAMADKPVYLMLNKPVQVVSTVRDPEGRPTVLDYIPEAYRSARLYPVGRLDFFSEGLLLLTNDGELTHRMTHPRFHLPKRYVVIVRENPDESVLQIMRNGMRLAEGERLAPVRIDYAGPTERGIKPSGHILNFVLMQGVNRQIRRMCRDSNLTILKLSRVSQGPLELGDLESGKCRELVSSEVKSLFKAAQTRD